MRRGHPGIGGWRNDNPRHFRPRSGGTPHFRPPRGYGHTETPRFQPPGRSIIHPPPYHHNGPPIDTPDHDRNIYRGSRQNNQRRPHDRGPHYPPSGQRDMYPILNRMRHGDVPEHNSYQDTQKYYNNNQNPWESINSMGDIDHRQPPMLSNQGQHIISPWITKPYNYEKRSPSKAFRQQDLAEHNKMPQPDYTGHRPPASDHYGGNHGSTMDNSNTFSRSVDDTVDIVRKRLLNRESQPISEEASLGNDAETPREPMSGQYLNIQEDQPTKKKHHKHRNMKSNCDKIKSKIVHQLFMMDKDKIHKLMDNPNSSSKFEYAISSLVTESQNSYNRHLRSVAEKSLCGPSSTDFINNDNNTIYEDTFMKQMEGLLDPQDTVLLEDLKPIVLAELSKVLQLDDLQLSQEAEETSYLKDDQSQYNQYTDEHYDNYNRYPPYSPTDEHDNYYEQKPSEFDRSQIPTYDNESANYDNPQEFETKPLFERRKPQQTSDCSKSRRTSEEWRRQERRSVDSKAENNIPRPNTPKPLFDSNTEHFSEDEDPFAELDRQYHVAVDHNFIENEYMGPSSPPTSNKCRALSPIKKDIISRQEHTPERPILKRKRLPSYTKTPEKPGVLVKVKAEIDHQLQDMAKSPLEFLSPRSRDQTELEELEMKQEQIKQELLTHYLDDNNGSNSFAPKTHTKSLDAEIKTENITINLEHTSKPQSNETTPVKAENASSIGKDATPTDSRKRSTDQKPSHRKEKRKKSESSQPELNKQIMNKNIIIHVSDCAKTSEKSFFNLYFSKENNANESLKENKKTDSSDKKYSEKYVKRKEKENSSKKSKEKDSDTKKKHDASTSSHSITSPDISSTSSGQTPSKTDSQTKLKPIDMFTEHPKKPNVHQAHRNTAAPITTPNKSTPVELKPVVLSRKITKRHIATQVTRKCLSKEIQTIECKSSSSRFCQTERKKQMTRGAQTDPVSFKPASKSTDAFERMKEIDMEIQSLLQEKFKLYNSLESKESCPNTMQSLGMAVLNVTSTDTNEEESILCEDTIVDDFTSIPVEELEQIALESVQEEQQKIATQAEKRSRRKKKVQEKGRKRRNSSQSTNASTTSTRNKRTAKTPNISLLEQIITDDRPLEEIISLDDLESPPPKKKSQKSKPKPQSKTTPQPQITPRPQITPQPQTTPQPKPKKKTKKKVYKSLAIVYDDLKPCSVVIKREDLNELLQNFNKVKTDDPEPAIPKVANTVSPTESIKSESAVEIPVTETNKPEIIEEDGLINDIQFDMLDVSEDIVIGDVCEVKSEEKEAGGSAITAVSEEIILDNSQSIDGAALAETGSECKTFDYSADENLRRDSITVSGNGDAVLAIECIDNNFIAACLDGNVYHFTCDGKLLNTLRGSNLAVTCLTIVKEKYGTTVYTGSLDSRIRYYDLETGMEKGPECNVLSPIQTMDRAWDTVFVGTRTGFVLQFECKNNMLIPVSTVKFSDQSILALRAMKEGPRKVLLVAARSEPVTVKDAQTGLLLRTLDGPKMTVYTLLFEDGKVYCGTSSHQIHVFDYSSGTHIGTHSGGKGAVCVRAAGGLVFAGCYDGCVYVYREGDPAPVAQLRGPSLMLLSLAILDTKIIAGYKDRSLYIWKIPSAIQQEMIL